MHAPVVQTDSEAKHKILIDCSPYVVLLFVHSFLHYNLESYQTRFYIMIVTYLTLLIFAACIQKFSIMASELFLTIILSSFSPLAFIIMPSFTIFGILGNFLCLMLLACQKYNPYTLIVYLAVNIVGYFASYLVYVLDKDSMIATSPEFTFIFTNIDYSGQVVMATCASYGIIIATTKQKQFMTRQRQQYEERLLTLNQDLSQTNMKFQVLNKDLKHALVEKENFTLKFSHEIRNPLNSLLGNIELCCESASDSQTIEMLKDAKVSGEILLQLLNNVLDTTKVSTGRLDVNIQTYDVRLFLERTWIVCSEIIRKSNLYGSLGLNFKVPTLLEFDQHRLTQILINLVSNAAKFTKSGFIRIYVDFDETSSITQEQIEPRYIDFLGAKHDDANTLISYSNNNFSNECSQYNHDALTFTNRKFKSRSKTVVSTEEKKLQEKMILYRTQAMAQNLLNKAYAETEINYNKDYRSSERKSNKISIKSSHTNLTNPKEKEGYLRVEIIDSGCGIKKDDIQNLFKKFSQVNEESAYRQIGTGLGLWITKELVELMQGRIEVYSTAGVGTCFVMMIKSKSKTSGPTPQHPRITTVQTIEPDRSDIEKKKVLVVEDIPYNQEINRRFLEKYGIKDITICSNGREAFDIYKAKGEKYFDVIFMDIDMPVMDGKVATKLIRQYEYQHKWSPAHIIVLTAYAESSMQNDLLNSYGPYKANIFLTKPGSFETIKKSLNDTFNSMTPKSNPKKSINRNKVLIVDDDSLNLDVMGKMITKCGVDFIKASNGKQAVDLYKKHLDEIMMVLMDCEMPIMHGFEATKEIRKYQEETLNKDSSLKNSPPPVFGLTGHNSSSYRQSCKDAGMSDMITKPIAMEMLKKILSFDVS